MPLTVGKLLSITLHLANQVFSVLNPAPNSYRFYTMHFINILAVALPLLAIPGSVIANLAHHPVNPEYYKLGCPNSTKPYASKEQQLQAITNYGNLLYLQKKIETAEYTYVATDFINHAPEVR